MDPIRNFARAKVSTGYNASATSIVLDSGTGALFPNPSVDGQFNLIWWNSTDFSNPTDDPNREIVRVTARSGDTLTITRGIEGTPASIKNIANTEYSVIQSYTAFLHTQLKQYIDDGLNSKVSAKLSAISASSANITPNFSTHRYYERTAQAANFTLNSPSGGVVGDTINLVLTPTGSNRTISFNVNWKFLENNDAPTELELGFTYDFVLTKTNNSFIISWGRVEN